uniref:Helix-turn-helix n=1 Tax=Candidatus Kentrum sp. LPFa TaxID=2126335 RepID=A0A450X3R1_9GAMM|nr:MAG: Helix-turn-helix [Candidatus Kentron sp. LPFa]
MRANFGQRLIEERGKLNLSQSDFAKIGGVARGAQSNYERELRKPDLEYLTGLMDAGVDIQYVLTGKRSAHEDSLKPEEEALLDNYRNSSEDSQRILRETSAALAQQPGKKRKTG